MTAAELAANTTVATNNIVVRNAREWVVPSRRIVGQTYLVARNRHGDLTCNCEAAFRGMRCWHIAVVEERFPDSKPANADLDALGVALLTGKGRR